METLADWGEFRILREIVLPAFAGSSLALPLGDDCAYAPIPHGDNLLVITADPAPQPLAWSLGIQQYSVWGWYSVLINVSDLAAAGARPLALTTSVEAPASMLVDDLRGFFSGVASACREMGVSNAGGNIRVAPRFECHGTAVGTVIQGQQITRQGCRPGDAIFVVGESGRFISAYLQARSFGIETIAAEDRARLLRPMPQVHAMNVLRNSGLLHAASDNSDGVLGALLNIGERSKCGFEINLEDDLVPNKIIEVAESEGLEPWNLMFFWGDWQVIVAVAANSVVEFKAVTSINNIQTLHLGHAIDGASVVYGLKNGDRHVINVLRQENFKATSYNENIDRQLRYMLTTPLYTSG